MRGLPGTAWVGTEAGWLWAAWGAWLPAGPPLPVCGSNPRASRDSGLVWAWTGRWGYPRPLHSAVCMCVCGVWMRGVCVFYVLGVYGERVRDVRGSDVASTRARPFVYRQVFLTLGGTYYHPSSRPSFLPLLGSVHAADTCEVPARAESRCWACVRERSSGSLPCGAHDPLGRPTVTT